MLDHTQMTQILSSSGCTIPVDATEEDLQACYDALETLSSTADVDIAQIKKFLWENQSKLFVDALGRLRTLLHACWATLLTADCDFLIESMNAQKLVICETMVERFSANLSAFSIAFLTARYRVITRAKEEDKPSQQVAEDLHVLVSDTSAEKQPMILAVDDSPEILNTLKGILSGRYRFFAVSSGKAALKFLDIHAPDLFIFDIDMPEMNGFELAGSQKVKTTGKPLIFLTSNANQDSVMNALKVGARDFIVKPCDEKIILQKLESILGV